LYSKRTELLPIVGLFTGMCTLTQSSYYMEIFTVPFERLCLTNQTKNAFILIIITPQRMIYKSIIVCVDNVQLLNEL